MIIGVISDTHGLLRPQALEALAGAAHILHAGDVGSLEVLDALARIAPVTAVRGNVDRGPDFRGLPEEQTVTLAGRVIHVIHQADLLRPRPGWDVVVSGHSHLPRIETVDGVLRLNPGSAGPRRFRLPVTVGRLFVEEAGVRAEIVKLLIG